MYDIDYNGLISDIWATFFLLRAQRTASVKEVPKLRSEPSLT